MGVDTHGGRTDPHEWANTGLLEYLAPGSIFHGTVNRLEMTSRLKPAVQFPMMDQE